MKKWDPFKDSFAMRERVNRLFEHLAPKSGRHGDAGAGVWMPAVDVYETDEVFVVKAELPEVVESDISITLEDNILRISGERRSKREGRNYYQMERNYGSFSRSFTLPSTVERDEIRATLRDGMLSVVLPKIAEDLARHIEIN